MYTKKPNLLEDEEMKQESKDEFYEIISTEYLFILTDAM